ELLSEKARQGVHVFVIYDSFGSFGAAGLWRPRPRIFEMMRRSGVRLAEFHPIRPWEGRYSWRPVQRDHRKLLIIDDEVAGLGGLNVGAEYAGSWVTASGAAKKEDEGEQGGCDFWRDNAMGLIGPAAQ